MKRLRILGVSYESTLSLKKGDEGMKTKGERGVAGKC